MDEYERGMDPEVKIYFRRIMKSFSAGLIWFLFISTMAFYLKMAYVGNAVTWQNIAFYSLLFISFVAVVYYLRRLWKNDFIKSKP